MQVQQWEGNACPVGYGPRHRTECELVHRWIFPQHKDGAGLAKDQRVPRTDPATPTKEDAWPDITDPPADPKQHLACFRLQGQLVFQFASDQEKPWGWRTDGPCHPTTGWVVPPLPAGLVSSGKNILAQHQ